MPELVISETRERVSTVTLNRPEARNALNVQLLRELKAALRQAEGDDAVDVVVLTGADPAFCAGLDLKELGSGDGLLVEGDATGGTHQDGSPMRGPFPKMTKPIIGAINGVAVTGGFELALNCSFLIASEKARFADTHSRVGIMPGWGLSVLLPRAIGVRRAREMSATGNFLSATDALAWGLVNRVVPHDELLDTAIALATDITSNDQLAVRRLLQTYEENESLGEVDALLHESAIAADWQKNQFSAEAVEARRTAIAERGRKQTR